MPLDFPTSPSVNDTYSLGPRTWKYNGYGWEMVGTIVGYTGSKGGIGYTGSKGADGTSITLKGVVSNSSSLPPSGNVPGDAYVTSDTGHIWVWGGSSWSDAGSFVGYTGSKGYTGSQGAGYTGSKGTFNAWVVKTSTYTAANEDRIIADGSGGGFTINLPATPSVGNYVLITDGDNFETNNITIGRNGSTIEGYSDDVLLTLSGATFEFIYDGSTWQVTSTFGPIGYTGSAGSAGYTGSVGYTGSSPTLWTETVTFEGTQEVMNTKTGATGTVAHDFLTGAVWYHSSISSNFTANFTNIPTTNDRTLAIALVLSQGVTPYIPNAVQIDGSSQTINWLGGIAPTGTSNKVEVASFNLIRTGSTWTVLGSLTSFG